MIFSSKILQYHTISNSLKATELNLKNYMDFFLIFPSFIITKISGIKVSNH